jgi:hypothetical protein
VLAFAVSLTIISIIASARYFVKQNLGAYQIFISFAFNGLEEVYWLRTTGRFYQTPARVSGLPAHPGFMDPQRRSHELPPFKDMKRKTLPPGLSEYFEEIGRKGGLKGGPARAAKLTPKQRSDSARKAVQARWAKVRQRQPV